MPSWKVLNVQSRYEFKVEQQFERLGIVHYLPKLKVARQWSDRIKTLQVPAFPSYLFVYNDSRDRNEVFLAKGVLHYLKHDHKDATLSEQEMELLKHSGSAIQESSLQPIGVLKGRPVLVRFGPLTGHKGVLVEQVGKKAVQLKLDSIAMGFLVELPMEHIQFC